jgi:uracil-DNA glycosylase
MDKRAIDLADLQKDVSACKKCKLCSTRTQTVFGEGSAAAKIMFIGEGPGREEDLQGRPFVGKSGQLLTAIIEKGMKIPRSEVFIANIVKCRPTVDMKFERDRPPDEEEVSACSGYLTKQIEIIKPEVIITLGNPSTRFILQTQIGITKMRGVWGRYNGIPVMPTYHPSFIIRNGGDSSPQKREVWEDIKKVLRYLDTGEIDGVKQKESPAVLKPEPVIESIHENQGKLF